MLFARRLKGLTAFKVRLFFLCSLSTRLPRDQVSKSPIRLVVVLVLVWVPF